jgi:xanthine dehydrogenase small subunit
MRDFLLLYLNGERLEIRGAHAFRTLSSYLRQDRAAMGTKIVCEEGDCGACTVLVGTPEDGALVYRPINSCILLLHQMDCTHVVTVEGVAPRGTLSAVQERMVEHQGAQCGFCTPGFVTALTALFESGEAADERAVRAGLTGNLCRCTGYQPIIEAALAVDPADVRRLGELYPPERMLGDFAEAADAPVRISAGAREYLGATTLESAVEARAAGAVIVQGATDVGVWVNKRAFAPPLVLGLCRVPGMTTIEERDGALEVGGSATLAALEAFVRERVPAFHGILERFGSPQIRNAGTLAGNVANASPIADTLPFLFVMGAQLEIAGRAGRRTVEIGAFYRGYKSLDLAPDELITRVRIPLPAEGEILRLYKISRRRDLDISTFTAALRITRDGDAIGEARIAYGGVGPVVLRLSRTEAWLRGRPFTEATFAEAGALAREEIAPIGDVRGSREYRLRLAENVLLRFYHETAGTEVYA